MSEHRATIVWKRNGGDFSYETYSRDHSWEFENGVEVAASGAPEFLGNPENLDPEETFVAALSSCHMLTFLAIAARKRLVVDAYRDSAVGHLEKNADGKLAITRVALRPRTTFADGFDLSDEELEKIHRIAHEHCFIANSVLTAVSIESG